MIIIKFQGGLGNQMFQYALYRSLVEEGKDVKGTTFFYSHNKHRSFSLDIFPNVNINFISDKEFEKIEQQFLHRPILRKIYDNIFRNQKMYFVENTKYDYFDTIKKFDNKILDGYFQSEKYFENVKQLVRNDFEFPKGEEKLVEFLYKLDNDENSVSIHLRRTDYLKEIKLYGNICTDEYYKKAVRRMTSANLYNFYVISDDIEWVKKNFELPNAIYINSSMFDNYQDWYDMAIMSHCKGNIMANSSFSWWGAWLNKKDGRIVVCPQKWINKRQNDSIYCQEWIRM